MLILLYTDGYIWQTWIWAVNVFKKQKKKKNRESTGFLVLTACESLKMMLKMCLMSENERKLAGIARDQKSARKTSSFFFFFFFFFFFSSPLHHGVCDVEGVEGAILTISSVIPGVVPVYSVVQLEPCIVYFALIYSD